MMTDTVLELSCWQFILTSLTHFIFMPLTLGLSLLLAIMETRYLLGGRQEHKIFCQFWGRVFAVNFVLAFATRLSLYFQFGMIGSYFSNYAGDVFALPLTIEVLSSCFLAAVLFGPYRYGWNKLAKGPHLLIIWLLAISVNISAFWIIIAYGWLQNPIAAGFNDLSFRVELNDATQLLNNPLLASKYLHILGAAYSCCAATLLAFSAWLLMKKPAGSLPRSSFKLAAVMGLFSTLALAAGDNTPHLDTAVQQRKLAILDGKDINRLLPDIEDHIRNGIKAYGLLQTLRDENKDPHIRADFNQLKSDLGYALLLQRWTTHIVDATDQQITQTARTALPAHPGLIVWSFRLMVALGIISLTAFAVSAWSSLRQPAMPDWLLKVAIYQLPLSWLASLAGWYVSEAGKQPWAIAGILPSFMSVSSLSVKELAISATLGIMTTVALLALGGYLLKNTLQSFAHPQSARENQS